MAGQALHRYDLKLCDYALGNVQQFMDKPKFRDWVSFQLGPGPLLDYVQAGADDAVERPLLLLNDREFKDLAITFQGGTEHDRYWLPYKELHGWYIETIMEVRDGLSRQAADDWSDECGRFGKLLEAKRLRLSAGIEVVHDWVTLLRRLLRAMSATSLLPAPEGASPTPTCRAPTSSQVNEVQISEKVLDAMRRAIAQHERESSGREDERGAHALPSVLIKIAKIQRQRAINALRELQRLGEYFGFTRGRPGRYGDTSHDKK